tara:strand:- start:13532 stop:13960 length:429 start_codon:yes stop_codon:yes gene_type:complete
MSIIRPTWDEYFKNIVEITALRSSCDRLNVGCIFVKDNRIIAHGYNGYIAGCEHKKIIQEDKNGNKHNIATIHAEQNAITDCAKRGVSSNDCTSYITHYPCYNCMKLMMSSGIKNIKYINDYKNDVLIKDLAENMKINIEKI